MKRNLIGKQKNEKASRHQSSRNVPFGKLLTKHRWREMEKLQGQYFKHTKSKNRLSQKQTILVISLKIFFNIDRKEIRITFCFMVNKRLVLRKANP